MVLIMLGEALTLTCLQLFMPMLSSVISSGCNVHSHVTC